MTTNVTIEDTSGAGDALTYVLATVFTTKADVVKSILVDSGVEDISDLMMLERVDLVAMEAHLNQEKVKLNLVQVRKLLRVQLWYLQQSIRTDTTWFLLQPSDIHNITNDEQASILPTLPISPVKQDASNYASGMTLATQAKLEFGKSVKKNMSDYPKLKDDKYFATWNRTLKAIACTHGTDDVLNPDYVPPYEEEDYFKELNKYMYSVLVTTLLTAKSKRHVRNFEQTQDAQKLYAVLHRDYTSGTTADVAIEALEKEITNMSLDDKWSKSIESFLDNWEHKVLDLENLQDRSIADHEKRRWLTSAIRPKKELYTAVTNAQTIEFTMSGMGSDKKKLSWDQFYSLIRSQAIVMDSQKPPKFPRKVKKGQQTGKNKDKDKEWDKTKSKYHIPKEKWDKMTSQERKAHIEKTKKALAAEREKQNSQTRVNAGEQTDKDKDKDKGDEKQVIVVAQGQQTPATDSSPKHTSTIAQRLLSQQQSNPSRTVNIADQSSKEPIILKICKNHVTYKVNSMSVKGQGALIDGGANGGLSGTDVRVLATTDRFADITGIVNNSVTDIPICTVAGVVQTDSGPAIGIFHQYAHADTGDTVHSANQLRHFGNIVDDKPRAVGGKQYIQTPDGYKIDLSIRNGLAYMDMYPPSDSELDTLPHIMFTSDEIWDPECLDSEPKEPSEDIYEQETIPLYDINKAHMYHINKSILPKHPDYKQLQPNFGWLPIETIKNTLGHTTQWYRAEGRLPFRKHYKTRFPAANVSRLPEKVATDTFYSDCPAADDRITGHAGATMVQLYAGLDSHLTEVYPMQSENQMANTFMDFIRKHGAPDMLVSDNAKTQVGSAILEILRQYNIKQHTSEPHYQNQNYAERRIQDVLHITMAVMDRTRTPPEYWLLCMQYVVYLLNHTSSNGQVPLTKAHGQPTDCSALLQFRWFEPVYYQNHEASFPTTSTERLGRWVGVAETSGDALTYHILDVETLHVVTRSVVRTALKLDQYNQKVSEPIPSGGEQDHVGVKIHSLKDLMPPDIDPNEINLPTFSPTELLGKSFLTTDMDGNKFKATIIKKIQDKEAATHQDLKFLIDVADGAYEDIMGYTEVCDAIEEQAQQNEESENGEFCTYNEIVGHEGPLKPSDPKYKGSKYNLHIEWTDGSTTWEPMGIIIKDDPIECARYGYKHKLLNKPGWKQLKPFVNRHRNLIIKATKMKKDEIFKFGVKVPRNPKEAFALDAINGNNKWKVATETEINKLDEYEVFEDMGKGVPPPEGYQKIIVSIIYDVKHDLRHRARMVAGGHLTPECNDSYSGVISLRTLRLAILIGELNGLDIMVGDIQSAYLEAYTNEKVYIIAGPEFGELEGHTLIIRKALYGLRTSGARFHDRLADALRAMNFFPCKADPDLWMRDQETHYDYVCVYVDDLMAIMDKPADFFKELTEKHGFTLKGVGPPEYHLGGNFYRDPDGTLVWGAQDYIKRMLDNYVLMFGELPNYASSPLVTGDSPELDQTTELELPDVKKYQSLIGALQWCITLGRFDIACAVMTMSRFRVCPRIGHLNRLKRMCGYLRKKNEGAIRFRTNIPDNESYYDMPEYDWMYSVYGNCPESVDPTDPTPRGKYVRTTSFVDANLYHCKLTGRAATGILHVVNQTPIDWFSKRQSTVETATYGSEFVAGRIATEQIIDLRITLRSMGVPIDGKSWLLGDNKSVITSSTIPTSTLNKRHNALAYHKVRSTIASGAMMFCHIKGTENPADVMTKFLPYPTSWGLIQPFLFCRGETIPAGTDGE